MRRRCRASQSRRPARTATSARTCSARSSSTSPARPSGPTARGPRAAAAAGPADAPPRWASQSQRCVAPSRPLCFDACRSADPYMRGRGLRYVSRAQQRFSPNVDVYYCGDPQRAVSRSISPGSSSAERSGSRSAAGTWRSSANGRCRRPRARLPAGRDSLGAVPAVSSCRSRSTPSRAKADLRGRVLRIELPLRDPAETTRRVPIGRE